MSTAREVVSALAWRGCRGFGLCSGIALLILLTLVIVGNTQRPVEPRYQSRTATQWLDDLEERKNSEYPLAIQRIGTNILPYILQSIEPVQSPWRKAYSRARERIPTLLRNFFPQAGATFDVMDATDALVAIGPAAVPPCLNYLKHSNPVVRQAAAQALGSLAAPSTSRTAVIGALIEALEDENIEVRGYAIGSLGNIGPEASNAVPAIASYLTGPKDRRDANFGKGLQLRAVEALGLMGPAAGGAIGVLKANLSPAAAVDVTGNRMQIQVAIAIWRIDGDVETALPVLLREIPASEDYRKCEWLQVLGEMARQNEVARSFLVRILNEEQRDWVLECASNALAAATHRLSPN
ncbi:MAG TPA: HEAT repeat domain-containing protein [Verrucomicrobiae bacterium]|nr:HEAT repeat domain-containing protein [Verrucomicrobiae bacterium]